MPVRNQNWYNLQATRRYPLDDKSTGVDDAGNMIRDDIIVDCHIRFPKDLGSYLYVQGISVSDNLVTILFGVTSTLTSTANTTIAALSVPKPAEINMNYAVQAIQPGVSGWVVLGPGIESNFVGRYSQAQQTLIGLRNARGYSTLPVQTISKLNVGQTLSGLVQITAAAPVTARYLDEYTVPEEQRLPKYDPQLDETNTAPIRAILFSAETSTAAFNPLREFLGPCGQRPESGTCPKKPIERINGVSPDCATGNINIVFGPGLTSRLFAECGGLDVTTPKGLSAACQTDPKSEKKLKDKCCEGPDALAEYCWPPLDAAGKTICELNNAPVEDLPICISFSPCHTGVFDVVSGSYGVRTATAPPVCGPPEPGFSKHDVYSANSAAALNIALYRGGASDWAYNHTISAEVKPRAGGTQQNGGIIANYMRVTEGGRCKTKYIAALVNIGASELQIYRYDGTNLLKENSLTVNVDTANWYRISLTAVPGVSNAAVTATLYDITSATNVATLTTTIADYEAVDGRAGLFTNGSFAYFNKFEVV